MKKTDWKRLWYKLYKWEYWPWWVFYSPVVFHWIYSSLRCGTIFHFSTANPEMELGGMLEYSKHEILNKIPAQYSPESLFIGSISDRNETLHKMQENGISFPVFIKPDQGQRAKNVKKIVDKDALFKYFESVNENLILQSSIESPLEFGVMYHRFPGEEKGRITSIVEKVLLTVAGDGKNNIKQLLEKDARAFMYIPKLERNYPKKMTLIPKNGEIVTVEPIGNHHKGTLFLNANHLINEKMEATFDRITKDIKGFNLGRFDLKVNDIADLDSGKNLKILELNGVNSEPAHIYHPGTPIFKAYKDVFRHLKLVYRISKCNHELGHEYTPFKKALRMFIRHFRKKQLV